MINHFWSLCKTCPSTGFDKDVHSEYRSTFKWHQYSPSTIVVRKAPRRTRTAGAHHGSIMGSSRVVGGTHESVDLVTSRSRMSQHQPSEEKTLINGSIGGHVQPSGTITGGVRGGSVTTVAPKAAAATQDPPPPPATKKEPEEGGSQPPQTPRKSKSMGRIHGIGEGGGGGGPQDAPAGKEEGGGGAAPTAFRGHRRVPSDGVAWRHSKAMESEMDGDDKFLKRSYKSEYRKKFRPFSQYQYVDGKFHKSKTEGGEVGNTWYKEVLELRRQAGQYRCRGWGVETASDRMAEIYNKQVELWEQVSRRSSLQALSLASAAPSRPISKAEKELENSRRSSPIKHARDRPSTAPTKQKPITVHKTGEKVDGKVQKDSTPRHHYEKTTGAPDGYLITSPSRDRIEPITITDGQSRRSPRKTPPATSPIKDGVASKRRPPRAISIARTSAAKDTKPPNKSSSVLGRSVSVGPENRSPKRSSRPPSTTHGQAPSAKSAERRPRPTSLTTSTRRKGTGDSAIPHHEAKKPAKKTHDISASPKRSADLKSRDEKRHSSEEEPKKEKDAKDASRESLKDATGRKATPEPRFDPDKYEPVVKTPPEPTRVKSPDQVMVKSPDPVNWTVPLDTGKTFTVTHNIPEGETSRGTPSSEHRPLEPRSRQTPEPTKVYQGSLAGTPITTAGTSSAVSSATAASSTTASSAPQLPPKSESVTTTKATTPASSTPPTSVPTTSVNLECPKEPVSGTVSDSSDTPYPDSKLPDHKESKEMSHDTSTTSTATKSVDSKPLTSIKETSPQPVESSLPNTSEVVETKSSPVSSSMGLSSDTVADPMTMSVFGSINGMNGKSSGSPSPTKLESTLPEVTKESPESRPYGPRNVPGTNLKCLDDPNFLDDKTSPTASVQKASQGYKVLDAPSEPVHSKPGSYRVLEAPESSLEKKKDVSEIPPPQPAEGSVKPPPYRVLEAPVEPPRPKGSPYRVLEAPDSGLSQPSQPIGSAQDSKPPSLISPSSGRTVTEALDKARTRFDSFWGGGKDKDPPSKV